MNKYTNEQEEAIILAFERSEVRERIKARIKVGAMLLLLGIGILILLALTVAIDNGVKHFILG